MAPVASEPNEFRSAAGSTLGELAIGGRVFRASGPNGRDSSPIEVATLKGHSGIVGRIAFHPDRDLMASADGALIPGLAGRFRRGDPCPSLRAERVKGPQSGLGMQRAAEGAEEPLAERVPHPQDLEERPAGGLGPAPIVIMVPLDHLDEGLQGGRVVARPQGRRALHVPLADRRR